MIYKKIISSKYLSHQKIISCQQKMILTPKFYYSKKKKFKLHKEENLLYLKIWGRNSISHKCLFLNFSHENKKEKFPSEIKRNIFHNNGKSRTSKHSSTQGLHNSEILKHYWISKSIFLVRKGKKFKKA